MGSCASKQKQKQERPTQNFSIPPFDTDKLIGKTLPQLTFRANLSNIKLKNVQGGSLSMIFEIQKIKTFNMIQTKPGSSKSIKWKVKHDFSFNANQYEIRNRTVTIKLLQNSIEIGILKINLYLVATGPYHHDFNIYLKERKNARVNFDLRISQIVNVTAQTLEATLNLQDNNQKQFAFTLKTIIGNSTWASNPSYHIRRRYKQDFESNVQTKSKKQTNLENIEYEKIIGYQQAMIWKREECPQMPQFNVQFPFDEFPSATLQIIFWAFTNKQIFDAKFIVSSTFSFNKFIGDNFEIFERNSKLYQNYKVQLQQNLKIDGKKVGKCKLLIGLQVEQHLKQMQVCVRTEFGIQSSSPIFTDCQCSNDELLQLVKINKQIQSYFLSLENQQNSSRLERKKTVSKILQSLNKELELLKISFKQSTIIYRYGSSDQLVKGIVVLLEASKKVLTFLKEQNQEIRNGCWPVLIALMKRGQFTLTYIGFDNEQIRMIKKNEINTVLAGKIKTALKYQQFLYKLLQIALKSLEVKGFQQEQYFAEKFCAYAYFRIPAFREEILSVIIHQGDPQINQWRGTQFQLNEDLDFNQMKQNSNTFKTMFDWGDHFHKCLMTQDKGIDNQNKLKELLSQKKWKQRLAKRSNAYFSFIQYWVQHVAQLTVKTKDMKWNYFPGYNKIIQSYMVMLKTLPIQKQSVQMKKTASTLLSNQKLLNIFVTIMLSMTNLYDPNQVIRSLQIISRYFLALRTNGVLVPSSFNYINFWKALKILLESEFAFAIAKTLQLFYDYFDLYSIQFQTTISMYLLGKFFFRFFLHWSNNVRLIFYHLLIMRIYHETNIISQNTGQLKLKYVNDIKPRYERLMLMLQNAQKTRLEEQRKKIHINYEKQLYKKMRKKLIQMKKRVIQPQSLGKEDNTNFELSKLSKTNKSQELPKISYAYDVQELSKPKLQRYNSEVMKYSVLEAINNRKQQDKNDGGEQNRNREETKVNYADSGKKKSINLNPLNEEDYKILSPTANQIIYLVISMDEYSKVNQTYLKLLTDNRIKIFRVKLQIPVDEKDFRPQGIDQW